MYQKRPIILSSTVGQKRPTTGSKETYYSVSKETYHTINHRGSNETYYGVKRDLLQCIKRDLSYYQAPCQVVHRHLTELPLLESELGDKRVDLTLHVGNGPGWRLCETSL